MLTSPDNMLERYGGLSFVSRLVLRFYDRVLASVRLNPYFADTDMQRLVEHQAKFLASVMGGPEAHAPAALRSAHAHLHIDDGAFDEMIDLLRSTLEEFQIAPVDVKAIIADLNARRGEIVVHCGGGTSGARSPRSS